MEDPGHGGEWWHMPRALSHTPSHVLDHLPNLRENKLISQHKFKGLVHWGI